MATQHDTILTITGFDGTGESGVQADLRFITALGGIAVSVVTSITVQNTLGIQEFHDLSAPVVRMQVEAIINDIQPQIVKIGLLRSVGQVKALTEVLLKYRPRHIIYAPVMLSTRGEQMITEEVFCAVREYLLPLCTVVLEQPEKMLSERKLEHGQSNQLSSAVAVYLSKGLKPEAAIEKAVEKLNKPSAGYVEQNDRSSELYNLFLHELENFHRRYTDVAFYAEQLNVTPRYLSQVTKRVVGKSPKTTIDEYITKQIMHHLSTTTYSIKETVQVFGFSSQSQLTRYFKKQTGFSPRQYKQYNIKQ